MSSFFAKPLLFKIIIKRNKGNKNSLYQSKAKALTPLNYF